MNRSIFQICAVYFKDLNILFFLVIVYFINIQFCSCVFFHDTGKYLNEICYNNKNFSYSKNINIDQLNISLSLFIKNKVYYKNFSICKYYILNNNSLKLFDNYSCYSHPNLFFGVYNNLCFNLQFSHHQINHNYKFFSNPDIYNKFRIQYLCHQILIYDNILQQQFLNYNDLKINNHTPYKNYNSNLIQSYINLNIDDFNGIIKKSLKKLVFLNLKVN